MQAYMKPASDELEAELIADEVLVALEALDELGKFFQGKLMLLNSIPQDFHALIDFAGFHH
jgi:hypothetical protein